MRKPSVSFSTFHSFWNNWGRSGCFVNFCIRFHEWWLTWWILSSICVRLCVHHKILRLGPKVVCWDSWTLSVFMLVVKLLLFDSFRSPRFAIPNQPGQLRNKPRWGCRKIKPESQSPNLTRTRATPGGSETYQICFRTPCPRLLDSWPSTSTDTPPNPRGLVVRDSALDPWPPEQVSVNLPSKSRNSIAP